jgi:hypothetical protein
MSDGYSAEVRPPAASGKDGRTPPENTRRGFWDPWAESEARLGLMPPDFAGRVHLALRRSGGAVDTSPEVLLDWAVIKIGSAQVSLSLLHQLRRHPESVRLALAPTPEILEVAALTLASAGVLAALDLCADAIYRASGGTPRKNGHFKDLGYWKKLSLTQRADHLRRVISARVWLENLLASPELKRLEAARHALLHRHVGHARSVQALVAKLDGHGGFRAEDILGSPTVMLPRAPGVAATRLGSLDDLVTGLLAFGEREVLACRSALHLDAVVDEA